MASAAASGSSSSIPSTSNGSKARAISTSYELPWSVFSSTQPIYSEQHAHLHVLFLALSLSFTHLILLSRVEKYRPLRLDDVVGNKPTIDRLKVIQEDGNCPHLLISVSKLSNMQLSSLLPHLFSYPPFHFVFLAMYSRDYLESERRLRFIVWLMLYSETLTRKVSWN